MVEIVCKYTFSNHRKMKSGCGKMQTTLEKRQNKQTDNANLLVILIFCLRIGYYEYLLYLPFTFPLYNIGEVRKTGFSAECDLHFII